MVVRKIIRVGTIPLIPGSIEEVTDKQELNKLYGLKIKELMERIELCDHKDRLEFIDLLQCVMQFADQNGFNAKNLKSGVMKRTKTQGNFKNVAIVCDPNNILNAFYFREENKLI